MLGLTVVVLPRCRQKQRRGGGFYLTTSQFGPNFYIGNNARAERYVHVACASGGGTGVRGARRDRALRKRRQVGICRRAKCRAIGRSGHSFVRSILWRG